MTYCIHLCYYFTGFEKKGGAMPELVGFKSQRHKRMFEQLVEFCGLDGIDYNDNGDWEESSRSRSLKTT